MKVFVTGATGYLGRHLTATLRDEGYSVTGIGSGDCDLRREQSLLNYREQFDQIWHLAAWTQAGDFCLHHPGEQWVINQRINTNMLDWWHEYQPQAKMIAIGSSCAYAPGAELKEENYLHGEPVAELYSYGMTKRMLLVGLRALAGQYGLRFLYLVPSTLFGPGYHTEGKQLHFIFDIIRKIVRGKLLNEPVVLWGDGHQKREIVFVKDFVSAALRLVSTVDGEIVNIGSSQEHTIRWFADQVSRLVEYDPQSIRYDQDRYTGVRSKQLSIRKLQALLPDFHFTPAEAALRETVHWYMDALQTSVDKA